MKNILLIDNYDSFVYNIARYFEQLGCHCQVVRNNKLTVSDVKDYHPTHIVISPGPCTPNEAGISLELVEKFYKLVPILGICLGHQAIGQVFGAKIDRAIKPMHGRASSIRYKPKGLFSNVTSPVKVGRYHSLIVNPENLSNDLEITAYSDENEIMAMSHKIYPLHGVQFHPESILTSCGYELLSWFIEERVR